MAAAMTPDKEGDGHRFSHLGVKAFGWIGKSVDASCFELRILIPIDNTVAHDVLRWTDKEQAAWLGSLAQQFTHNVREGYFA